MIFPNKISVRYKILVLIIPICLFLFASCTEEQSATDTQGIAAMPAAPAPKKTIDSITNNDISTVDDRPDFVLKYDLNNPDFTGNLPSVLVEISALTYNPKDQTLLAVNDERGILYTINARDCSMKHKVKFAGNGDYEGVEIVGNMVYVLKANGNLTPIDITSAKVEKQYKTPLSTTNDVEGLGYDEMENELILACKESPELKKAPKLKNTKAFYTFDLESKKLNKTPKFTISDRQLEDFLAFHPIAGASKKAKKKLKNRLTSFSPSAIARSPKDGYFYILSSVGKLLIVCDEEGVLIHINFLDQKKFTQPEGLCFAPDGTLFISNEGKSLKANIMRFAYQ